MKTYLESYLLAISYETCLIRQSLGHLEMALIEFGCSIYLSIMTIMTNAQIRLFNQHGGGGGGGGGKSFSSR